MQGGTTMDVINQYVEMIVEYFNNLTGLVPIFLSIALGAVLIIWGYKLFRLWLFAFGAQSGYSLGTMIVDRADITGTLSYIIIGICILAIALLFWVSLRFSFAVAGFALGAFLMYHYGMLVFGVNSIWAILIGGILCGVLAYLFIRLFIVAGTSIYGAFMLSDGLHSLIFKTEAGAYLNVQETPDATVSLVLTGLTIVFIVLGFIYQYNISDKGKRIKVSD